jgi:hypothetical protein
MLGTTLAVVTVVLATSQALAWYRSHTHPDLRVAATHILAGSQPGDAVLIFPPASFKSLALEYYVQRLSAAGQAPMVERIAGIRDPTGRVHRLGVRHQRVWLVLYGSVDEPTAAMTRWRAAFEAEFLLSGHTRVSELDIYLFEAHTAASGQP